MWIVKLALRRPYTFIVLAIVITLFGVFAIWRTPTDIFPNIRIPVVATVWKYTGLSPEEMATRLILNGERTAQTTVNDVEHTESQSVSGTSVVKYFFQPNVNEELSYAQITGVSQTMLRFALTACPATMSPRHSLSRIRSCRRGPKKSATGNTSSRSTPIRRPWPSSTTCRSPPATAA